MFTSYKKAAAFFLVSLLSAFSTIAAAQAPAEKNLFKVFSFEDALVIALYDGPAQINDALAGAQKEEIQKLVRASRRNPTMNAFAVVQNEDQILIDTGAGPFMEQNQGGKALAAIKATDILKPEKITAILLTHLHFDHVGGLMKAGKPVFPNATIYVTQKELDYWNNDKNITNPDHQFMFDAARAFQKAYNIQVIKPDQKILSNITVVNEYGHTPGHVGFLLKTADAAILFSGDVIHHIDVQIKNPAIYLTFDTDSKQAIKTRKRILNWVSDQKIILAGAHIPFPGVVVIEKNKKGQFRYRQFVQPTRKPDC